MRASRLAFVAGSVVLALMGSGAWAAGPPRVVFLRSGPPPQAFVDAFRQGLRKAGYVEGRDVVVDYRVTDGRSEQLAPLARDVVASRPAAILASASPAAFAAHAATTTIPIVFVANADPVENGLVASLAQPGGNVTGLTFLSLDLLGKRLELLRELIPKLSRVALLWNPTTPPHALQVQRAHDLARTLGVSLQDVAVRTPGDFDKALRAARSAQALLDLDDPLFTTYREQLAALAAKYRVPVIYGYREMVEAGGLMSYGAHLPDLYLRAAGYIDRVLKGTPPRELPIEQPTTFELVINMKAAKAIGLTIPRPVLERADELIR